MLFGLPIPICLTYRAARRAGAQPHALAGAMQGSHRLERAGALRGRRTASMLAHVVLGGGALASPPCSTCRARLGLADDPGLRLRELEAIASVIVGGTALKRRRRQDRRHRDRRHPAFVISNILNLIAASSAWYSTPPCRASSSRRLPTAESSIAKIFIAAGFTRCHQQFRINRNTRRHSQ